jgi:hypothetical protein
MDRVSGFRIGRVNEAKDFAFFLVDPVVQIVDSMLVLLLQVQHMGLGDSGGFHAG